MAALRSGEGDCQIAYSHSDCAGYDRYTKGLRDPKVLEDANPAATSLLIDGMNQVLKTVPNEQDKQDSSYSDPTLPVAPRLISGISSFVIKAKQQRPSVEFWRNGRYCEGNDVRPNCEPSANS